MKRRKNCPGGSPTASQRPARRSRRRDRSGAARSVERPGREGLDGRHRKSESAPRPRQAGGGPSRQPGKQADRHGEPPTPGSEEGREAAAAKERRGKRQPPKSAPRRGIEARRRKSARRGSRRCGSEKGGAGGIAPCVRAPPRTAAQPRGADPTARRTPGCRCLRHLLRRIAFVSTRLGDRGLVAVPGRAPHGSWPSAPWSRGWTPARALALVGAGGAILWRSPVRRYRAFDRTDATPMEPVACRPLSMQGRGTRTPTDDYRGSASSCGRLAMRGLAHCRLIALGVCSPPSSSAWGGRYDGLDPGAVEALRGVEAGLLAGYTRSLVLCSPPRNAAGRELKHAAESTGAGSTNATRATQVCCAA